MCFPDSSSCISLYQVLLYMPYTLRMLQVCSQAKFRCDWMHTRIRSHHWPAMRSRICPIQVSCHRYSFPCLSPFVYCSTAPIRLQVFPVPSKALQIESLHPTNASNFAFRTHGYISALRMPFVRSGTILSLTEVVSMIGWLLAVVMNRTFSVFRSIGLARVPYFYSIGKPNSPLMAEMGVCFQIASGRFGLIDGLKTQTCADLCMWLSIQNQGLLHSRVNRYKLLLGLSGFKKPSFPALATRRFAHQDKSLAESIS